MCGIAGWVKAGSRDQAQTLVKEMTSRISHRGPDDHGYYFAPGVAFGHRRLSIIDLEHGHQPMSISGGSLVIVYNGEVYNYRQLAGELEKEGERFVTSSDTEVVARAFLRWGMDAPARFKGMFAFAVWDNRDGSLYLVRDQLGVKPLYYAELGDELIFASEIKALFCHPGLSRRLDRRVLIDFLTCNNTFGENSFWQGVKRCQPGEIIRWRQGRMESLRFFDVQRIQPQGFSGSFQDAVLSYRATLDASVADHLVSDVPVGSYLSSGLDSGSVAALAARKIQSPLASFTGYFDSHQHGWFDERPAARELAVMYGMRQYECPITEKDFSLRMEKVAYHLDEPTLGSTAVPQFVVAETARKHVKVVLTGHGGDELFAGYPVFKAIAVRENPLSAQALSCIICGGLDERIRMFYFLSGGMHNPFLANGQVQMYDWKELKRILTPGAAEEGPTLATRFFSCRPSALDVTRWYLATYLPTLLLQEDKVSMAHGLESRLPICYEPVVRFALSLPVSTKLAGGKLKSLPREAMQGILPRVYHSSPKRGFPVPLVSWLSGSLGRKWEALWRCGLPAALQGILNPEAVCREFSSFRGLPCRLPDAYLRAHRLVSFQMLYYCCKTMDNVPVVSASRLMQEVPAGLPGTAVLC